MNRRRSSLLNADNRRNSGSRSRCRRLNDDMHPQARDRCPEHPPRPLAALREFLECVEEMDERFAEILFHLLPLLFVHSCGGRLAEALRPPDVLPPTGPPENPFGPSGTACCLRALLSNVGYNSKHSRMECQA